MKKTIFILGAFLLAFFVLGGFALKGPNEKNIVEKTDQVGTSQGDLAPDFDVLDIAGQRRTLKNFTDKNVLVITSTASWCPTCIIEAKEFSPVYQEFKDQGVEFFSVSIDPTDDDEKLKKFREDWGTPWPYTHPGREGVQKLIVDYQLTRFEITYVIDRGGVIRFKDQTITSQDKLRSVLAEIVLGEQKPELGVVYPDQGQEHIPLGAAHPAYNSDPPTSGWHYDRPAPWGVYEIELPDEQLVHNLEHGGIWISHKEFIAKEDIEALRSLAREYPSKVIVTVREKNPSPIAIAAWGRLMELESFDRDLIVKFIEQYKNQGPEFIPD